MKPPHSAKLGMPPDIASRIEEIIDTLLLSCRILGKGVEDAFVKTVLNLLRLDGYRHVKAQYLPTAKNMQTADFYDRLGMTCVKISPDGVKDYEMDLKQVFEIKNCYNIRYTWK